MGRYAQARRRGGGPPVPTEVPGTILSVVVQNDPHEVVVTFNIPISIDSGPLPDGGFSLDGIPPIAVSQVDGPNTVRCFQADPVPLGGGAGLSFQPNWLLTSVPTPQTPTITGSIYALAFSINPFQTIVQFSGPITISAWIDDGAFQFPFSVISAVSQSAADSLVFALDVPPSSGDGFSVNFQPSYIDEALCNPFTVIIP